MEIEGDERLIIRSNTPEGVDSFDEYGFAVFSDEQGDIERDHNYTSTKEFAPEHVSAWRRYMASVHTDTPHKARSLLKRGLPRELRPKLWRRLLGCEQQQSTSSFSYPECIRALRSQLVELGISEYCLRPASQRVWDRDEDGTAKGLKGRHAPTKMRHLIPLQILRQIMVDLERTFPSHRLFMGSRPEAKEGRASLFRLLSVYALYNPAVGYCQGMSYLAGMLLMVMSDEEAAFWAMVALFEKPKFLAGYFDHNLKRIQTHAALFHSLLGERFPRVAKHFDTLGVQPLMYVTPWFMCLYTSLPCWDTVLAIWDLIILDGVRTIFRVGLSLIEVHQEVITQNKDLTKILPPLLHPSPDRVNHEALMPVIWKTRVEKWEVETMQAVIAEGHTPRGTGAKRQHHEEKKESVEVSEGSKKVKVEEKPDPSAAAGNSGFLQRVFGMFTPRNQRDEAPTTGPTRRSEVQVRTHQNQVRTVRKGPGAAKPMATRHSPRARDRSIQKASKTDMPSSSTCSANQRNNPTTCNSGTDRMASVGSTQHVRRAPSQNASQRKTPSRTNRSTPIRRGLKSHNSNDGNAKQALDSKVPNDTDGEKKKQGLSTEKKKRRSLSAPHSRPTPVTPTSRGRSKMFGRLHAKVFGGAENVKPKLAHPLEDADSSFSPSTLRPGSGRRQGKSPRRTPSSLRKSPRTRAMAQSQRTSRSNWLSPYCNQYTVKPAPTPRHSANRHKRSSTGPASSTESSPMVWSPDFLTAVSPRTTTNSRGSPSCVSPDAPSPQQVFLPIGDGASRQSPSLESLCSTPDGVLSVLQNESSKRVTEQRSPLSSLDNNNSLFKTPAHPMQLRARQHTPGTFRAKTPRSEGRHLGARKNPLNTPSSRRLVCKTAKAQRSFTIFHTPTPLRKSKVLDLQQSPTFSSPEVELQPLQGAWSPAELGLHKMDLTDSSPVA